MNRFWASWYWEVWSYLRKLNINRRQTDKYLENGVMLFYIDFYFLQKNIDCHTLWPLLLIFQKVHLQFSNNLLFENKTIVSKIIVNYYIFKKLRCYFLPSNIFAVLLQLLHFAWLYFQPSLYCIIVGIRTQSERNHSLSVVFVNQNWILYCLG